MPRMEVSCSTRHMSSSARSRPYLQGQHGTLTTSETHWVTSIDVFHSWRQMSLSTRSWPPLQKQHDMLTGIIWDSAETARRMPAQQAPQSCQAGGCHRQWVWRAASQPGGKCLGAPKQQLKSQCTPAYGQVTLCSCLWRLLEQWRKPIVTTCSLQQPGACALSGHAAQL